MEENEKEHNVKVEEDEKGKENVEVEEDEGKVEDNAEIIGEDEKFFPKHEDEKMLNEPESAHEKLIPHEEVKLLKEDLEDQITRLRAEFDNFRRRSEEDRKRIVEGANYELLKEIIGVMDEFDSAIEMDEETSEGVKMIRKNLAKVLEKNGAKEMQLKQGDWFDPIYHEAVEKVQSDLEDGKIVKIVKKGYMFRDGVLRHAKVSVSKGNE